LHYLFLFRAVNFGRCCSFDTKAQAVSAIRKAAGACPGGFDSRNAAMGVIAAFEYSRVTLF
jgi:hypothetical protein